MESHGGSQRLMENLGGSQVLKNDIGVVAKVECNEIWNKHSIRIIITMDLSSLRSISYERMRARPSLTIYVADYFQCFQDGQEFINKY